MFKIFSNKLVVVAAMCTMAVVACGDADETPAQSAAVSAASELLSYVPADSPYVFANLAPLPDEVMDKLEPSIDRILQSYEVLLQELVVMANEKAATDADDEAKAQKAAAVIGQLSSLMSIDGLRSVGFERDSRAVIYGNGLLPVVRFEVSDGALFEAALARMEVSAGEQMERAQIAGKPVRFVEVDNFKILVSILDKQVVISLAPASFGDDQLSRLLGFTTPATNIAAAGVLQKISGTYGFEPYLTGYFDIARVAQTLTGGASGLDAEILAMAGDAAQLSDICSSEIRAMAGIAPRMVVGYTEFSTTRFRQQAIFELREDIAKGLQALPASVPGLGGDNGALLSFGMSLNLKAVRDFVEQQLDAMGKAPYECEYFAELQGGVAQAQASLQQPVPPMVYDFRGFVAVIRDIQGLDMARQTPPTSVDGQVLLAMNNATALVGLGAMMSPELASLNLQPDGKPVRLDLPQAQMLGQDVYVAMSNDALAFSVGDDAQGGLGNMLQAKSTDNGTFFSFSMDAARYYGFIADAMAAQEPDDDSAMSPRFRQAMQDMMHAIADIYDRIAVDMRFTDKGVVMDSVVTLGNSAGT